MRETNTDCVLLIDTNVWLDYFIAARTNHASAFSLIDYAISRGVQLAYAPHALKDAFYLCQAKAKENARDEKGTLSEADARIAADIAWNLVDGIAEHATAIGVDESDVWIARKYRAAHDDLEDNLVLAAAQRSKATFLVTNDERLIKHAPVPALTAEDALAHLRLALGK